MTYAPIARIILRYIVGAALLGSDKIGGQLAADPDLVFFVSAALGLANETFYAIAKKRGWTL